MFTIEGPITIKKGEDILKNEKFKKHFEKEGVKGPFDERPGKTTFKQAAIKNIKIKKEQGNETIEKPLITAEPVYIDPLKINE